MFHDFSFQTWICTSFNDKAPCIWNSIIDRRTNQGSHHLFITSRLLRNKTLTTVYLLNGTTLTRLLQNEIASSTTTTTLTHELKTSSFSHKSSPACMTQQAEAQLRLAGCARGRGRFILRRPLWAPRWPQFAMACSISPTASLYLSSTLRFPGSIGGGGVASLICIRGICKTHE